MNNEKEGDSNQLSIKVFFSLPGELYADFLKRCEEEKVSSDQKLRWVLQRELRKIPYQKRIFNRQHKKPEVPNSFKPQEHPKPALII